jgi:hypothetical protein
MEDQVRRSIMIALIALLALAMAVPTVLAQPPAKPNPNAPEEILVEAVVPAQEDPTVDTEPPFSLASLGCDFDLGVVVTGKTKTIELPNGGTITTAPAQNVTVTNLESGEQATFNITGVTFSSPPDENGIVSTTITGRNLAFDPAGTFLNIGRFTFAIDTTMGEEFPIVEPQQGKGQAIDVCALLS